MTSNPVNRIIQKWFMFFKFAAVLGRNDPRVRPNPVRMWKGKTDVCGCEPEKADDNGGRCRPRAW